MKIRNFKINKRKLFSLLLASGICLTSFGNAEINSYNANVYLNNGNEAKLYFSKQVDDINYAYISSSNMVGFVYESDIVLGNIAPNNYFVEDNNRVAVVSDIAYIYQTPEVNNTKIVGILNKNDIVNLMAKTGDGWYVIYTNGITGFMYETSFIDLKSENTITLAKLTKNNVNVRYSATTKIDNIIGFADVTDSFRIIGKEDNWYIVDYLGQNGYIREDFVKEIDVNKSDYEVTRVAYLQEDSYFYTDLNNNYSIILPAYQNVGILDEVNDYYKVMVDGVVGYVLKNNVKRLTKTCVVIDLSRQLLKVFKNGNEVFRAHIISGRQSLQTQIGCFKIGHKIQGYQLTPNNYVDYWIQYDDNRGIHDASWQSDKYYSEVAYHAYDNFGSGYGKTYPYKYGSHGCDNMKLIDVINVYNLVNVGDNVLVIGPNGLIKNHLISKVDNNSVSLFTEDNIKVKKLV